MPHELYSSILGALLIFVLRITDVSIGTIRTIYVIREQRYKAACLGLIESAVFIFAVSSVLTGDKDVIRMIGYACGFAAGTLLGVTLEGKIASGFSILRVISREKSHELLPMLRDRGHGVTSVKGEGRDGEVLILFVVCKRRRTRETVRKIREIDPKAFLTTDSIGQVIGGIGSHASPLGLFKK